MFLDDEIYQIGKNSGTEPVDQIDTLAKMLSVTFIHLNKQLNGSTNYKVLFTCFKRVNNSFVLAIRRLKKEGNSVFHEDDFKKYCQSVPGLNSISTILK